MKTALAGGDGDRRTDMCRDDDTQQAAERLREFLVAERALLPAEHPWRRAYGRQLIRLGVLFPTPELTE